MKNSLALKVKSVIFVPRTPSSKLCKLLRAEEQRLAFITGYCFSDQDVQRIADDDFSYCQLRPLLCCGATFTGHQKLSCAGGPPVQHAPRLHLSQYSYQDQSSKPELRRLLSRQVIICQGQPSFILLYLCSLSEAECLCQFMTIPPILTIDCDHTPPIESYPVHPTLQVTFPPICAIFVVYMMMF